MRVAVEVGHGGKDEGAVGLGRYEKDDNLRFALVLEKEFLRQGFEVTMTRTSDVWLSTWEKCQKEHSPKCDIAIAIHRNGFTDPKSNGFEIWIHSQAGERIYNWASLIGDDVAKTGMFVRGVHRGFRGNPQLNYYWNGGTVSPSMLIENGFITNERDNKLFDENLDYYVRSIVKRSCEYLKVPYIKLNPQTGTKEC